jgi:uncharacterized protein (TIGR00162 family)
LQSQEPKGLLIALKVEVVVKDKPRLSSPMVVCGLPGSAFVGKLAVDHLISELSAKPLAEFYCDGFAPQIVIGDDGVAALMKNEMFYWKGTRDLILYTGDSQPATSEAEYTLSEAIIDYLVGEHNARNLVTLGAFVTGSFATKPKVYAASTDESLIKTVEEVGCVKMTDGAITGMNGLLLGMAKLKGMTGFTLLGETSGYVLDPKAAEAVLLALAKITTVNVSMKKMQERAKEAEAVMQTVERMRGRQARAESESSDTAEKKRPEYIS